MFRNSESPQFRGEMIDDLEKSEETDVEEKIVEVQQKILSSVDLVPASGNILNEIFDAARISYEKDPKGWDVLFDALTSELVSADGEDEAADILDLYERKATALNKP